MASTLGKYNPLRYRGYVYDQETGLYYLQSRYYNPEICRFINADVYVSTGQDILGYNMFAYCNNNPVIYEDTTGKALKPCFVVMNDSTGGYRHIGTTNSHDLIKMNENNKTTIVIQFINEFKESDDARAVSGLNDIRLGIKNIKTSGELILAPCPTIAEDLVGVGLFIFGVVKTVGGLTKVTIYLERK